MNLKKFLSVVFFSALATIGITDISAQSRPRFAPLSNPIKKTVSSQPTNLPTNQTQNTTQRISRPVLTSPITLVQPAEKAVALVKKTVDTAPTAVATVAEAVSPVAAAFNARLTKAMDAKLGIRYVYGSEGPNAYDCSSLVWTVFREAGISFDRSSARNYWQQFEVVTGDDRFKFGTLVFFNQLGHVGIVVDEKGFYHASSSKGVTYSSFEGYWAKRIVGFRRIPASMLNF